jgi:hypothetical protein
MIVECRYVRESGVNRANCGHCGEASVGYRRVPPGLVSALVSNRTVAL